MATITKNQLGVRQFSASPPYGNLSVMRYNVTLSSAGAVSGSNSTTAVAVGDVIRAGIIPAGMTLLDFQAVISDAWVASTTCKIGFQYVDGVDVTAVPQDDDYFVPAAQSLASAAIIRKTATTAPVTLPKDAYLIITIAGAAQNAAAITDLAVIGEIVGPA